MKEAQAWIEEVAFCECPSCYQMVDLGTDVSFGDEPWETHCQKCGVNYVIKPPECT